MPFLISIKFIVSKIVKNVLDKPIQATKVIIVSIYSFWEIFLEQNIKYEIEEA